MYNQLKIEGYKAVRFKAIYVLGAIIVFLGFYTGLNGKYDPSGINCSRIFAEAVCDTSLLFMITPVIAWFAGNDFTNRTVHNEIKLGNSRFSVIITRTVTAFIMMAAVHFACIVSLVIGFSMRKSFDSSLFTMRNFAWLMVVFLQLFALTCCVMFIVFLTKKAVAAVGITVIFSFIALNALRNFLGDSFFRLTCFSLPQTSDTGTLAWSAVLAVIMIAAVLGASYMAFRKAEIK